jgi:hypothetical protein
MSSVSLSMPTNRLSIGTVEGEGPRTRLTFGCNGIVIAYVQIYRVGVSRVNPPFGG